MLGPITVVTTGRIWFCKKGAVSAVFCLDQSDVGIGGDGLAGIGGEADEGIVEGVQDQSGHGDAMEDSGGSGAVVVIVRTGKTGIERGDAIVELAKRMDSCGAVSVVSPGEEHGLSAEAAQQVVEEL